MQNLKQSQGLRQAGCGPECGFLVRSTDEREILRTTAAHLKEFHQMDLTDEQLRGSIQSAPK